MDLISQVGLDKSLGSGLVVSGYFKPDPNQISVPPQLISFDDEEQWHSSSPPQMAKLMSSELI